MKKALLIGFAMLFVASAVSAAPNCCEWGYIGLFADGGHSVCNVNAPAPFFPFTMWVWCMPSIRGMQAAEFMVAYPANVIGSTVTQNPLINVALGSLNAGISVSFSECQATWQWTHQQSCFLMDMNANTIQIVAHPGSGVYQFATCEIGFPLEPTTRLTHLYLNQNCVYATQDASWGAIKSLF